MGRLIKMDFYRLFQSRLFWILSGVFFVLKFITSFIEPILVDWLVQMSGGEDIGFTLDVRLSEVIETSVPGLLMIIMFISLTSFLYADIKNGYIKNIAGQIPGKGLTAVSKFVIMLAHNLFYGIMGAVAGFAGYFLSPSSNFIFDEDIAQGIEVFFIKYLLTLAMGAIVLFITTGLYSNVFAIVLSVLFCVGALSLLYMGIDQIISLLKIKNFSISNYVPDMLYQNISVDAMNKPESAIALTSVIVAVVFTALFVAGAVVLFNKRDVK